MSGNRVESLLKCTIAAILLLIAPVALAEDEPSDKSKEKAKESKPSLTCEMTYRLKGWSAIYKTAKGKGTISCSNGEKADVKISVHGGGITFGKTEIVDGKAKITGGRSIDEIYGSYAQASAHAGAGKAADAAVLTKGEVSITLAG